MPPTTDLRFAVAAARRMLYRNGCDSAVAGQVTARIPGRDAFWMTPLEYLDETTVSSVVDVAFDGGLADPAQPVSPAADFHAVIYARRPDVGAIVHTHSPAVSTFATIGSVVGQYNVAASLFFEDQALYEDDGVVRSLDGDRMLAALDGRCVLWLKNHGVVVLAPSVEVATVKAMTI
jgi:L-fuculose-phosphate aldolase